MHKVGVFDSGIGGLSIANAIQASVDNVEVTYINDAENMPYGTKSVDELKKLVGPKIEELIAGNCTVIVIACNTVTTTLISWLRETYPVQFIGIEPMIKPAAALTKTGIITVCATPTTLASARYAYLKQEFASGITVLEPDCSRWSKMIESDDVDTDEIKNIVEGSCRQGSDVIVLGCTHYHWIEELINRLAKGRAKIIQPEKAIINRLQVILQELE